MPILNSYLSSVSKARFLLSLEIKAFFHRLRYDLAREIVVGISAAILLVLFMYIFNDFLNVKIEAISVKMRLVLARWASALILISTTVLLSRPLRRERQKKNSYAFFFQRMGEAPEVIQAFKVSRSLLFILLFYGAAWFFIDSYLEKPTLNTFIAGQSLALLLLWLLYSLPLREQRETKPPAVELLEVDKATISKISAMTRWRFRQLLFRNRLTQFSLFLATLFTFFIALTSFIHGPYFLAVLTALVAGIFAAITMAFQLEEDLKYAWAERCMGISHHDISTTYLRLGIMLGVGIGSISGVAYFVAGAWNVSQFLLAAKLVAISAFPSLIIPSLLFQIDPRRPIIQIITCSLVSLFIGTAIFAHWLSILLVPLVKYYGDQHQKDRFYRA